MRKPPIPTTAAVQGVLVFLLLVATGCSDAAPPTGTDLCTGLITDARPHPIKPLAKPAPGETVIDPVFGTRITRITNADPGMVIKPLYSTVPAWNADESYLILYHTGRGARAGHSLYDGRTYEYIKELRIAPPDLEQVYWDHADPHTLYYIRNRGRGAAYLMRLNVTTDEEEVVHEIPCGRKLYGNSHGFISWDSDIWGLGCRGRTRKDKVMFWFSLLTGKEGIRQSYQKGGAPLVAPSGRLFYQAGNVLDRKLNIVRALDVGNPFEHASLGRTLDGRDTYNEVSFDGRHIGSLVTHDMQSGEVRVIIGPKTGYPYPPSATHVSAIAFKNPGWVAISSVGKRRGIKPLDMELYLANTNPGQWQVCRVAHHRSWGKAGKKGYWAEPHVVISPSGTRLLFGSDWENSGSVDTYVVELPAYGRK